MATIYVLCDPRVTDPVLRVRYVGMTVWTPARRLAKHLITARKRRTHLYCWITSLMRAGYEPAIETYCEVPTDLAPAAEIRAIALLRMLGADLTNGTIGGDGVIGHVHDAATRARLSAAHTGRTLPAEHRAKLAAHWRRFWADPVTRAKAIEAKRGHLVTDEGRANMSAAQRGRVVSPEARVRISASLRGLKQSPASQAKRSASLLAHYSDPAARARLVEARRIARQRRG